MTTLQYPQLGTRAICQFPIRKVRRTRTITNRAADGSSIKLADAAGLISEWTLTYTDMTDGEAEALQTFFEAMEGSLCGFTFLDPAGNLLAWSEQLNHDVWQKDPLLQLTAGVSDPRGADRAWRLVNNALAGQALVQTIAAAGVYQYCVSAFLRSATPVNARLWAGPDSCNCEVTPVWTRFALGSSPAPGETSMRFGIETDALAAVEVYGIQVEAQAGASGYKATSRGGVYEGAHFRDDVLAVTKTGVNRNSCTVNIIHANHL